MNSQRNLIIHEDMKLAQNGSETEWGREHRMRTAVKGKMAWVQRLPQKLTDYLTSYM